MASTPKEVGNPGGAAEQEADSWPVYSPNSLTKLVGGSKQSAVEAFDVECRRAFPSLGKSEWPCAFEDISSRGCTFQQRKGEPCVRCQAQKDRAQPLALPGSALSNIFKAATLAVRKMLKPVK